MKANGMRKCEFGFRVYDFLLKSKCLHQLLLNFQLHRHFLTKTSFLYQVSFLKTVFNHLLIWHVVLVWPKLLRLNNNSILLGKLSQESCVYRLLSYALSNLNFGEGLIDLPQYVPSNPLN